MLKNEIYKLIFLKIIAKFRIFKMYDGYILFKIRYYTCGKSLEKFEKKNLLSVLTVLRYIIQ